MEVNFNNLRRKACIAYDQLCNTLNQKQAEYEKEYSEKGYLLLATEDIQKQMDDLRDIIGTIAMCYNEADDDMRDIYSELYPDDKSMKEFNPEKE